MSKINRDKWRVRLAKQEMLTPPGHLVSPLVCRSPWMSTVVLYGWCHSDSASVLLYFTFDFWVHLTSYAVMSIFIYWHFGYSMNMMNVNFAFRSTWLLQLAVQPNLLVEGFWCRVFVKLWHMSVNLPPYYIFWIW